MSNAEVTYCWKTGVKEELLVMDRDGRISSLDILSISYMLSISTPDSTTK